jgi:hypothetical protein
MRLLIQFALMVALVLVAGGVMAQESLGSIDLTPSGLWRWSMSIALAMGFGYIRGIKITTIDHAAKIEGLTKMLEIEGRQRLTELAILRETLPQTYWSKLEHREYEERQMRHTAEHRDRVETSLRDMTNSLQHVSNRLDALHRPEHRRSDDQ